VMCHISHVYPTGASLYFTVVAAQHADPIGQWTAAKRAAGDAIMANGGTITHHHAVGTEPPSVDGAGDRDLGVAILRAVKATVDPAGILNPGKLIHEDGGGTDQPDGAAPDGEPRRDGARSPDCVSGASRSATWSVPMPTMPPRWPAEQSRTASDAFVVVGGDGMIALALQVLVGHRRAARRHPGRNRQRPCA